MEGRAIRASSQMSKGCCEVKRSTPFRLQSMGRSTRPACSSSCGAGLGAGCAVAAVLGAASLVSALWQELLATPPLLSPAMKLPSCGKQLYRTEQLHLDAGKKLHLGAGESWGEYDRCSWLHACARSHSSRQER